MRLKVKRDFEDYHVNKLRVWTPMSLDDNVFQIIYFISFEDVYGQRK